MIKVRTIEYVNKELEKYLQFCKSNGLLSESEIANEMIEFDFKLACFAQIMRDDFDKVMDSCAEARKAYVESLKSN
jgi:hypothetical protein